MVKQPSREGVAEVGKKARSRHVGHGGGRGHKTASCRQKTGRAPKDLHRWRLRRRQRGDLMTGRITGGPERGQDYHRPLEGGGHYWQSSTDGQANPYHPEEGQKNTCGRETEGEAGEGQDAQAVLVAKEAQWLLAARPSRAPLVRVTTVAVGRRSTHIRGLPGSRARSSGSRQRAVRRTSGRRVASSIHSPSVRPSPARLTRSPRSSAGKASDM